MLLFPKDMFKVIVHHQREIVQHPDPSDLLILSMESNVNEGRRVTVVGIPPLLPSRSSSFYNMNGRTLVGSSMEGKNLLRRLQVLLLRGWRADLLRVDLMATS